MEIVFYTRSGCSLCEEGRRVVQRVVGERPWSEIDVDTDPQVQELYGEFVPVVEVDGIRVGQWRIEESRLREVVDGRRAPRRLFRRRGAR